MKNFIKKGLIMTNIATILLGTFAHFTFKICKMNSFAGALTPVNESVWEHLKIIFFPMLITALIEYLLIWKYSDRIPFTKFCVSKCTSIFFAMIFTLFVFYLYSGITGSDSVIADIVIFVAAICLSYLLFYRLLCNDYAFTEKKAVGITLIIATAAFGILLIIFTFFPPHIPLFKDPLSGGYGIY